MTDWEKNIGGSPQISERVYCLLAVLGSLALSWLAVVSDPVLNRDGMYYIEIAARAAHSGELHGGFDWPFYLYVLSFLIKISPFSAVATANLMNAGFSALATVSLYLLLSRVSGDKLRWFALLFALSFPGFNEYRSMLIREWPAWGLMLSSLYSFLRYCDTGLYRYGVAFFLLVFAGLLFRLEVAIVFLSLFVAALLHSNWRSWRGLIFWGVPGGMVFFAFLAGIVLVDGVSERFIKYWSALDLLSVVHDFQGYGEVVSSQLLNRFSEGFGAQIFFVGLLSIIPYEIICVYGILVLAFLWRRKFTASVDKSAYLSLSVAFLLVLVFFLINYLFLTTRYVVTLCLVMLPFLYNWWLSGYDSSSVSARRLMVFALVVLSIGTTYSSSGHEKLSLKQAGAWLKDGDEAVSYFNDGQVSFYAGYDYFDKKESFDAAAVPAGGLAVFRIGKEGVEDLLLSAGSLFSIEKTFDSNGDEVVVVLRKERK